MSLIGFVSRVLLVLLALWSGGLLAFGARVNVPDMPPGPADGIVVLTGSSGRIMAGLELWKQRPAARMLISGVDPATKRESLTDLFGITQAQFDCCIEIDRIAHDTVGNAEQTALWVRRHGLTSLVVVTAASHMPRSIVEMRRQMPSIRLERLPTRVGDDEPLRWGQGFSAVSRFIREYNKYLYSLVRARIFDEIGDVRQP